MVILKGHVLAFFSIALTTNCRTFDPGIARRTGTDGGETLGSRSVDKLAIGYVHNLSRRTALYGTVARIGIHNGHNNPTVMGVTPLVLSLPAILPQPGYITTGGMEPRRAVGYDLGIRHAF